jgi:hypothetical protein
MRPGELKSVRLGSSDSAAGPQSVERPGIYLHPELYDGAQIQVGEFVAEYQQSAATVNLRRLEVE